MSHRLQSHRYRSHVRRFASSPRQSPLWRLSRFAAVLITVTLVLSHVSSTTGRVIAYVVYWDQNRGFASAQRNISTLSAVSPWWYSLNYAGDVVPQDSRVTDIDSGRVKALRLSGVRTMPTISNHRNGEWDNAVVAAVLSDPVTRARHVRAIVDLAVRERYDGIDIDYENLPPGSRADFSAFVGALSSDLHRNRKLLAVDVHPKTSDRGTDGRNVAQDYAAIGAAADEVRIMTYDYHWATSAPGPVAPTEWVADVISYAVRHIPREKILMGVPLFGYDWIDRGVGRAVTWAQAQELAVKHKVEVNHEPRSGASWFDYVDQEHRRHAVWFEGPDAVAAKLRVARANGIAGVLLWRLGGESPRTWRILKLH